MRRMVGFLLVLGGARCSTRAATITHATLAGISAALAINASSEHCDDHNECDNLGADIGEAMFGTAAVVFRLGSLVTLAATPHPSPPPATPLPLPRRRRSTTPRRA